jgi:hypothetical protein
MCSPVGRGGEAAPQTMQALAPNAALPSMVMTDHEPEPTQQTKPKKGEPIEIPVPKKRDGLEGPSVTRRWVLLVRYPLAITVTAVLWLWLLGGSLIGAVVMASLLLLIGHLLERYDEQLRKPRRLPWTKPRDSGDASGSTQ